MIRKDLACLPVFASEPHTSADCIPHSSLAEFSVSADDYGLMFYGPHGQFVILGTREAGGTRCPALMATVPQHASHRGIHVVIKEKSH